MEPRLAPKIAARTPRLPLRAGYEAPCRSPGAWVFREKKPHARQSPDLNRSSQISVSADSRWVSMAGRLRWQRIPVGSIRVCYPRLELPFLFSYSLFYIGLSGFTAQLILHCPLPLVRVTRLSSRLLVLPVFQDHVLVDGADGCILGDRLPPTRLGVWRSFGARLRGRRGLVWLPDFASTFRTWAISTAN